MLRANELESCIVDGREECPIMLLYSLKYARIVVIGIRCHMCKWQGLNPLKVPGILAEGLALLVTDHVSLEQLARPTSELPEIAHNCETLVPQRQKHLRGCRLALLPLIARSLSTSSYS